MGEQGRPGAVFWTIKSQAVHHCGYFTNHWLVYCTRQIKITAYTRERDYYRARDLRHFRSAPVAVDLHVHASCTLHPHPQVLFVLFEHAAGYAIFRCQEAEDIGSLLPEVQEAVLDFARFGSVISLEAFVPFKTGANALENLNCISEGKLNVIYTCVDSTVYRSYKF